MYLLSLFFFFNDTATTEIYTLSLHDALPISDLSSLTISAPPSRVRWMIASSRSLAISSVTAMPPTVVKRGDRKSTRLNSSHSQISYAVFCLKKKKTRDRRHAPPWCDDHGAIY